MVAVLIMMLAAVLWGLGFEGTISLPRAVRGRAVLCVGRLCLGLYVYRPGRVYVQVARA